MQGGGGEHCEHGGREQVQGGGLEHLRAREAASDTAKEAGAGASASTGGSKELSDLQQEGGRPGICEHGRQRSRCKECGGSSICEHGRQRRKCKECGGSGASASTGERNHGCEGVPQRLATHAAPPPHPPSTPQSRFWSSPRTWRTRARTTSASYPEGCTINHHLGPIDKHPRGSRVGGGVITRHLWGCWRRGTLPSAPLRLRALPRTNPSASPITSPPPHPRRIPRHTRRCPSQSSAAHASEQYHAAPHRAQGANAVTFEGRFEGFWFFWSFPPSKESPESPTSPPPPPPPPPPVLFAILAGSSLRVLRRAPAPRTLTAGAAKSEGRAFAFAFFAPLSSRRMFENALAPHVSHAATPRVVGTSGHPSAPGRPRRGGGRRRPRARRRSGPAGRGRAPSPTLPRAKEEEARRRGASSVFRAWSHRRF